MESNKTDPKEISRRKTNRRRAIQSLAARRMGYASWSNFGTQFSENIIPLEGKGTEAQVNAVIKVILMRSLRAVMAGSKELDTELQDVIEKNPRIRKKW